MMEIAAYDAGAMKRVFISLLAALVMTGAGHAARKPNVILIMGDDMGYGDIGAHGCTDIPTPHIDSLAKGGVRCTNGYVSGTYCSPTRAALLTGRYQQRFGHEFNPGPAPAGTFGLRTDQKTLGDHFVAAGYKTGWVGKWHLGNKDGYLPGRTRVPGNVRLPGRRARLLCPEPCGRSPSQ